MQLSLLGWIALHTNSADPKAQGPWQEMKGFVERSTDVSMDALHVIVGVLLMFGVALLMRRTVADWRPWLVVLIAGIVNEAADFLSDPWTVPMMQYAEGFKDLAVTMLLPTAILLTARSLPRLYARKGAEAPEEASQS